jgi:hypothetical protein
MHRAEPFATLGYRNIAPIENHPLSCLRVGTSHAFGFFPTCQRKHTERGTRITKISESSAPWL